MNPKTKIGSARVWTHSSACAVEKLVLDAIVRQINRVGPRASLVRPRRRGAARGRPRRALTRSRPRRPDDRATVEQPTRPKIDAMGTRTGSQSASLRSGATREHV